MSSSTIFEPSMPWSLIDSISSRESWKYYSSWFQPQTVTKNITKRATASFKLSGLYGLLFNKRLKQILTPFSSFSLTKLLNCLNGFQINDLKQSCIEWQFQIRKRIFISGTASASLISYAEDKSLSFSLVCKQQSRNTTVTCIISCYTIKS